ncbi:KH domain-containing protein [Candidatus Mancarchaeum acidiphilum]|nr:KH domain-containing protein [Candidatus Mancarchaeum acidiphilum]
MQEVYIPAERLKLLKSNHDLLKRLEDTCNCHLKISQGNSIEIEGDAFDEFNAKNILYAFGRGFSIEIAEKLLNDEFYFTFIDLADYAKNKNRRTEIKARLIGNNGRTKKYIEEVSSAYLSIYGDTICFIGKADNIAEAETAAKTLIEGGSHRLAYRRMEAAHKRYRKAPESKEV